MAEIRIIRAADDLDALQPQWWQLWRSAAASPLLLECGLARLFLLRLDGVCAGAYYGMSDGRRAYAWVGGFDPEFSRESPGTPLIAHALEAAIDEGCRESHSLRGRERYKYRWGAVDRWSTRRVLSREPGGSRRPCLLSAPP